MDRLCHGESFRLLHTPKDRHVHNYPSVQQHLAETVKDIDRLVTAGWLEGPLHYRPHIVSAYQAVVKTNKFRLALDMTRSGLNDACTPLDCKLDSVTSLLEHLPLNWRMSKFDLTDAFLHWPVRQEEADLQGVQHPVTKEFYRYRYAIFGASPAPAWQQGWAQEIKRILNAKGLQYCTPGSPEADYETFRVIAAYLESRRLPRLSLA